MAMNYTLQHSAAPDSPIFNSENHLIADGDTSYVPENFIRTVFWQEAIHGQAATTTWVWERGQSSDLAENILTRANCVHALGQVGLDLQRLAPEAYALSGAPANPPLLYAYSSLLPSMDYYEEVRAAFEGAYFSSCVAEFVTESQLESGSLPPYKLIIVPRASHARVAVVAGLNRYIHDGGTLMTVGNCFTRDEYGRARSHGLVQSGRGRLVSYPDPLSPPAYRDILDHLLDQARVRPTVHIRGPHGEFLWGINVRAVEHKGKLLVNLLNLSREAQDVRFTTKPATKSALNLLDGKAVELPFTLPPLDPALLSLER